VTGSTVEDLYGEVLAAWNAADADAWGACFAEDGSLVGFDGSPVEGRTAIVEHVGGVFGDHDVATYVEKVREVRELAPGVALLRAVVGMVPPGEDDLKPEVTSIQALVAVETDAGWRIAHLQTTPAAFHGRPDDVEALTEELRAVRAQRVIDRS
jgi:uncharacterized protein (TIGR02246 family)